jgi:hypothetical protein
MPGNIMNRQEAIEHILFLASCVSSEFDVGDIEKRETRQQAIDALLAIGVTSDEIPDDEEQLRYDSYYDVEEGS